MDYTNCKLCPKGLCNGSQSGIIKDIFKSNKNVGYRIMPPCYTDPSLKEVSFAASIYRNGSGITGKYITTDNFSACIDYIINNAELELEDTLELLKYKNETV